MKEKKPTAKSLIKIGTLALWSVLGVVVVAGVRTLFYRLKIDWFTAFGAVGVPVCTWIWGWGKSRIDTVAKATEEYRKQIALKIETLSNAIDRLTIQQQADEALREQIIELRVELERLKSDINISERLRLVEQIIYRFTNEKDTNH